MNEHPIRHHVYAWAALLAFLGLSLGSAYVPLGHGNLVVNIAIAFIKAAIVMLLFMRARSSGGFVRLLALAGIFWLAIMMSLSFTDFATRGPFSKAVSTHRSD